MPAEWSVYRAAEAYDLAGLAGLDVSSMKRYLDPATIKLTEKPVCVIAKHKTCISFVAFLPDAYFLNMSELIKLTALIPNAVYSFNFEFIGFLPRRVEAEQKFIAYEDWLAGRPYISNEFRVNVRAQQGAPADRP